MRPRRAPSPWPPTPQPRLRRTPPPWDRTGAARLAAAVPGSAHAGRWAAGSRTRHSRRLRSRSSPPRGRPTDPVQPTGPLAFQPSMERSSTSKPMRDKPVSPVYPPSRPASHEGDHGSVEDTRPLASLLFARPSQVSGGHYGRPRRLEGARRLRVNRRSTGTTTTSSPAALPGGHRRLNPSDIATRSAAWAEQENPRGHGQSGPATAAGKKLILADGELATTNLIPPPGSPTSYFGHDAWAEHAPGLKTIEGRAPRFPLGGAAACWSALRGRRASETDSRARRRLGNDLSSVIGRRPEPEPRGGASRWPAAMAEVGATKTAPRRELPAPRCSGQAPRAARRGAATACFPGSMPRSRPRQPPAARQASGARRTIADVRVHPTSTDEGVTLRAARPAASASPRAHRELWETAGVQARRSPPPSACPSTGAGVVPGQPRPAAVPATRIRLLVGRRSRLGDRERGPSR
jgi:hypothetical protein